MNWYQKQIYAGIQPENIGDLYTILKELGCTMLNDKSRGKGDHTYWENPNTGGTTTIPDGPASRIVNPKTMEGCIKYLGIPFSLFNKYRMMRRNRAKGEVMEQIKEQIKAAPSTLPNRVNKEEPLKYDIPIPSPSSRNKNEEWKNAPWYKQQLQYVNSSSNKNTKQVFSEDMEETKDVRRGLYNQQQGDEYNHTVSEEILKDWEVSNKQELDILKAMAKQHRFKDMADYGEKLIQKGFSRSLVNKLQTAAMHGVKL